MGFGRLATMLALLSIGVAYAENDNVAVDSSGNQFTVCSDAPIIVKDISVLCDSPGTYYYGSNKYRNNEYCQAGDKARVYVELYVADEETLAAMLDEDGDIFLTLLVNGYGDVADKSLYEDADLCSLEKLSASNGAVCPGAGYYSISTSFYWNSVDTDDATSTQFSPSLLVGLKSDMNKNVYDLGGANTNKCNGNTFVTWSDSVKASYANAVLNFILTFGILIVTVIVMALFACNLWQRRDDGMSEDTKESLMDEDSRKVKMVSGNQDVLDF